MIEHFGVHHKGNKPSPMLGGQWKYDNDSSRASREHVGTIFIAPPPGA